MKYIKQNSGPNRAERRKELHERLASINPIKSSSAKRMHRQKRMDNIQRGFEKTMSFFKTVV